MNSKLVWAALAVLVVIIIFATGIVLYLDQSRELKTAQNQVQQFQATVATLNQKLEEKEKEKGELQKKIEYTEGDLQIQMRKVTTLSGNVETLGRCLKGSLELFLAVRREDAVGAMRILGAIEEPCKESLNIVRNLDKTRAVSNSY